MSLLGFCLILMKWVISLEQVIGVVLNRGSVSIFYLKILFIDMSLNILLQLTSTCIGRVEEIPLNICSSSGRNKAKISL